MLVFIHVTYFFWVSILGILLLCIFIQLCNYIFGPNRNRSLKWLLVFLSGFILSYFLSGFFFLHFIPNPHFSREMLKPLPSVTKNLNEYENIANQINNDRMWLIEQTQSQKYYKGHPFSSCNTLGSKTIKKIIKSAKYPSFSKNRELLTQVQSIKFCKDSRVDFRFYKLKRTFPASFDVGYASHTLSYNKNSSKIINKEREGEFPLNEKFTYKISKNLHTPW